MPMSIAHVLLQIRRSRLSAVIIISANWTEWNWRIYCFHFCVSVCLCLWALRPVFNSDGGWQASTQCVAQMYSTRAWKVDNISVQTIYHWNLCFFGFLKILSGSRWKWAFRRNVQKCNSYITQNVFSAAVQQWRDYHSWLVGVLRRKGIIYWSIRTRQSDCCLVRLV